MEECLNSIIIQTHLPSEIIIVDNANNIKTEEFINCNSNKFSDKSINIKYIKNEFNSVTIARNIGVDNAIGKILLFLDDDVVLNKDFIEQILLVYKKYPNAIGVQGLITNMKFSWCSNIIQNFFFLTHSKKNHNELLPSIRNIYAYPFTKIIKCEWLMSGCTCYLKDIFNEFKWDDKMHKSCSGDDDDFSYRIYKVHPGTLYQTPFAKLIHKVSDSGRAPKKESVYMGQVYHTYLFYKIMDQKFKNKLIFIWSRIGYLLIRIGVFIIKPSYENFKSIKYLIYAYIYCLKHINNIKRRDLEFFNKTLNVKIDT